MDAQIPFLQKKAFFLLTLAVIGTTLGSWFNLNSCLIIALVIFRLTDGGRPLEVVRRAFSNRFFLAYFSLFAIEAAGLFYTHDLYTAYKHVESKATLVAIPFVLCSGDVIDRQGFRQLMKAYCWLLVAISFLCLVVAGFRLWDTGRTGVFFYHELTAVIDLNAVFFSGYVLIALIFLLSPEGNGAFRGAMIAFFTVMMLLLNSKLLLALLAVVFIVSKSGWRGLPLKARRSIGVVELVIAGSTVLAVTHNPVQQRYQDILHDDWRYLGQHPNDRHAHFNGVSLRLLMWEFAEEIVNENNAWVIGVSAGDSQDLLNRKYLAAEMRYRGYNFHNQFVEIFVRSGVAGLCIFLAAIGLLVDLARRTGTRAGWLVLLVLLLLALTQSTLEMQHSLFAFCFFPLLFGFEALRGVHARSAQGVIADRREGEGDDADAGQREDPGMHGDAIGEALQPFVGRQPGQWAGDDDREQDQPEEGAADQQADVEQVCAEDLADTDLFCPLDRADGGQAEETEAGQEDGEGREERKDGGGALFRQV